ncbi:MAG: PAS domain S-box protein [Bacteroidota bacterium]
MDGAYTKYGRVFDLLPELIFILDKKGTILDYNASVSNQFFNDHNRKPAQSVFELVRGSQREDLANALGTIRTDLYLRSQFHNDGRRPMDVELTIKKLDPDSPEVLVLIANDITEKEKKELDLLRFSEVMQHTMSPIQITDAQGKIIFVNPAFERVSGYSKEELLGKNPSILNSGKQDEQYWQQVWNNILKGKEWVGQIQNRRKNGELFQTELVISPIVNPGGAVVGFLGSHRDITEQKLLEQQLVRSQKMETFGTLAAGIAHEVGNPLTSISSIVQVIQRTTKDHFAQEKLELVKNQVNRIAKIIRELVDFSRPSAYEVKQADVNTIVRDAINIVQYGKKVHDITFAIELDEDLPPVSVVHDQLVQVFLNIAMNAVDACEGRPGTIRIASRVMPESIEVTIQDTGKGIPETDFAKIFDPFYTTKEVGKGTGLGLWVSYGIVKNFGGDILVESKEGKGSTFTVILPLKGTTNV